MTFLSEFAYNVAFEWCGVYYIVVPLLGGPHRESLVMACGDGDVASSRCLDGCHPLAGIEARRIEARCRLAVFLKGYACVLHIPFALRKCGIQAPVQEYSEAHIGKFFSRFQILGSRRIGVLRLERRHCYGCHSCQ